MYGPIRLSSTPADAEEFIIRTLAALIRQGQPSINEDGCAYRGEEGRACAAGLWLSDKAYDERLEGRPAQEIAIMGYVTDQHPLALYRAEARLLQLVHDAASMAPGDFVHEIRAELLKFGKGGERMESWVMTYSREYLDRVWNLACEMADAGGEL